MSTLIAYIICSSWLHITTTWLDINLFKQSSNRKMGMRGTVKCRPTVAYWVQVDGINIPDWTDYKILLIQDIDPMLF